MMGRKAKAPDSEALYTCTAAFTCDLNDGTRDLNDGTPVTVRRGETFLGSHELVVRYHDAYFQPARPSWEHHHVRRQRDTRLDGKMAAG